MPSRNAVTFSGNFSPASAINSSRHFVRMPIVCAWRLLDLLGRQLARQQHRRHLRGVQDLVRIGVADAAQQMRIGERALQRVVLPRQGLAELP